jgi:hypothetical protein
LKSESKIVGDVSNEVVTAPARKKKYLYHQGLHQKAFEGDDWTRDMWDQSKNKMTAALRGCLCIFKL